jgi:uncharacterized protein
MRRSPARILAFTFLGLVIFLLFGRSIAVFYTDVLWYDALGHSAVFWKRLLAALVVHAVMGTLGAALIFGNVWYVLRHLGPVHLRRRYGNLEIAEQVPRGYLVGGAIVVSVLAGWWLSSLQFGGSVPVAVLAWLSHENWGITDPLFGRDISFYVFSLPLYLRVVEYALILLVWAILLVGIGYVLIGAIRVRGPKVDVDERPRFHFALLVAGVLVTLGMRYLLGRYHFMLEGSGIAGSIGYTDVHARLPARLVLGVLAFAVAGALLYGARRRAWLPPAVAIGVFIVAALGMGVVYPAVVQKVHVEPNQLAREVSYIRWNMEATQRAYGLDRIERRQFPYRRAGAGEWAAMMPVLEQLPLWDPGPLHQAFTHDQGRFRYYQFGDPDFDRYGPPGDRQQVAVAVRELRREGVPESARTWSNLHLNPIYTRGMGAVVVPAAAARRGEPVYWLGNINPVQRSAAAPPELELSDASIYFGETMSTYAVVGHTATFSGEEVNADGRQPPTPRVETGIALSSFGRILAFAWRFGDQNLLFARELSDTSRMLFRRQVVERVAAIAPFMLWDPDVQPVVMNGRVVWILDGYSASSNYPLARPFTIDNMGTLRYMRSSMKAVLDAVTGQVDLYALPEPDPILRTYQRVFPGLIREWDEMPETVRHHLRYPALLFRVQSTVLEEYHLQRPEAFYAGQDVWQLPQEAQPQARRRFRPDFMLAAMPGEGQPEFLLMNSFIALGRQNMTGLLLARSDAPNYGQLVLLEMPRDDQIRGPAQVQAFIEQDPFISQQLALWRQQGSSVELGRLRVVPTETSLLYVEPLFLAAAQAERAIPQLQQVIVSDGTAVAMADDLRTAVARLSGRDLAPAEVARDAADAPAPFAPAPAEEWRAQALQLMREADDRIRAGDFAGFGAAWARLRALLEQQAEGRP